MESIESLIAKRDKLIRTPPKSFEHSQMIEWAIRNLSRQISARTPKCTSENKRHDFKSAEVERLGINQWIFRCQNDGCNFFKSSTQIHRSNKNKLIKKIR